MKERAIIRMGQILVILLMLLISLMPISIVNAENSSEAEIMYVPHNSISINTGSQFTMANGVSSGMGDEFDPYIIEGWEIDGSMDDGSCIYISVPNVWVIIRDCWLYGAWNENPTPNPDDLHPSGIAVYEGHYEIDNCVIENNIHPESRGIYAYEVDDLEVTNCDINTNSDTGIDCYPLPFANPYNINNNTIHSNGHHGIDHSGIIDGSTIAWNEIYLNTGNGISWGGSNNNIHNNTVYNHATGFALYTISMTNSRIAYNEFSDNARGFSLQTTSGLEMYNNTIENNDIGIWVLNSNSDHLFWNRFINNAQQYDFTSGNTYWWNVTYYEGGGNYWSDYNGTDIYSGVNQNETGRDFIGDQNYSIGTITDYYPLINASGWVNLTIPAIYNYSVNNSGENILFTFYFYEFMNTSVYGNISTNLTDPINITWPNSTVLEVVLERPDANFTLYMNITDFISLDGHLMSEFNESVFIEIESLPPIPEPEIELNVYQIFQATLIGLLALIIILIFMKKMKDGLEDDLDLGG